jgi:hypothetical protein
MDVGRRMHARRGTAAGSPGEAEIAVIHSRKLLAVTAAGAAR